MHGTKYARSVWALFAVALVSRTNADTLVSNADFDKKILDTNRLASNERKVESVSVTGHYDMAIGTTDAASAGTVTAKLIENRPALRPGEILEFVPGLIVSQHSGDGKANQYFLRGFNLDHGTDFATTVAGMPVNMRSHAHGQGYTDLNFLIPELIERIDYKKGPFAAEEGDFANAGSAHLQLFDSLPRGIASFTGGAHDYARAAIANSTALADGVLLFGLDLSRNNGPWKTPENSRRGSGVLRYSSGASDSHYAITAMAYDARWNSTDQIPQRAVDSGLLDRFDAVDPTDGGNSARYSLSMDWDGSNAWGGFQVNAYGINSRVRLFNDFTYFLDSPSDLDAVIDGDQYAQSEHRSVCGGSAAQLWSAQLGGVASDNRIGVQGRYDRVDPLALYSSVAREIVATTSASKVTEASVGVYAENTLHWLPWLRTVAGIRFDDYRFDVHSDLAANSGKKSASISSPKLALILGPWADTEYFLNYGQGFHSNDARGITEHITPKERAATEPVTPLVKSWGIEAGARTEVISGLQSSLAFWKLHLDSELVFSGDAGDTGANRASQRHGIEWSNHYIAASWLLIDMDLSASKARYTQNTQAADSGNAVPGSIDRVASFGITLTELGPWSAALQWRYFGPRPLLEDNSQRSKSTALVYLRGGYAFNTAWKVNVDIFNLFDRQGSDIDYYYASRLRGEPSDGVEDIHFHPAEPRTARVSLTYNF